MGLIAFCLAYYLLAAVAMVLGYHRGLSHGSVRFRKGFERLLITLGLPAGTPIQWAGTHRRHHAHTDRPGDPHSPAQGGFWHSHCGWYIGTRRPALCLAYALAGPLRMAVDAWHRPRSNREFLSLAGDVAADPYYAWISRPLPYAAVMAGHIGLAFGAAYAGWGGAGILALWGTLAFIYNCGDAIDSVAHTFGRKDPEGRSEARNGLAMALLTFGDGWHANHHSHPGSARTGMGPGQIDLGWMAIRALQKFGLVEDAKIAGPLG